ncbi:NAD(P)H-binding protein [Bacillus sp. m3-13]|uniref:NAD(P)H-binding protein n=1 Tax=Bacillus sp. m3-13 TaxID=406124 RepID=UPI0001E89DF6|nr:NAD(P)H-binding protein [Bacillus sp. m3-13]
MNILVTGFNGKVGKEVAKNLKAKGLSIKCAVRNVDSLKREQNTYEFVSLDFTNPSTFDNALNEIDKIFLIYPPGADIKFEEFLNVAKQKKSKAYYLFIC